MAANNIIIRLTDNQQKQIRDATGKTVTELTLGPVATGPLSDQELDGVAGGLQFSFNLVAVKTISWSGAD